MALVEQLDSLAKLKLPLLTDENVPWAAHTPSCTLQHWSAAGPMLNSSVAVEQVANSIGHDRDRRSVTPWEETESVREDGELPVAFPAASLSEEPVKSIPNGFSELEHSRGLALITKSITPTKKVKSQYFSKQDDDPELMLDSESDLEEQSCLDQEAEDASKAIDEPWEDHGNREFHLILSRKDRNECIIKLEAKIKISMEYPLRPPLFSLSLSTDGSLGSAVWFNELCAMESEVNLHILKILPLECENSILAHQVRCLAMLFDFYFGTQNDKKMSTSVIDVGLCKPVSGTLLARSIRGRDRRKMLSWKGMGCSPGYPC